MSAPGYFGKLPGAGDFVQRRLPPVFVDAWDRAFSHAVAGARDLLGTGWSEAWQRAPAWRFLLSPGVAGAAAWAGVMLPGCDRVGRCFPMVVAAGLPTGCAAPGVLDDGGRWFDLVAGVAAAAQRDRGIDAARFDAAIAALALPPDPQDPTVPVPPPGFDGSRRGYWLPLCGHGLRLPSALWHRLAASGCTLWWQHGDRGHAGSLWVGRGLPDAQAFAALLGATPQAGAA
ncbi:type VI secretion system-associated protein TagF [Luteimonas sp. XNQY3]|nr:type VI secretion system-associated protein TagF [Luteimonas sp. XNQY3]MCD9007355.1 type VI secretion system-associated protein TagF [Luteimonas sp. XNQY3]